MNKNDLFYFCSVVEFIGRATNNHRKDIVKKLTDNDIQNEIESASVNHCLSFEQICDEWIEKYGIQKGDYDSVSNCRYKVPSYTAIGKVYQRLKILYPTMNNGSKPFERYLIHLSLMK